MSIQLRYMRKLFDESFRISQEKMCENAENHCEEQIERLKNSIQMQVQTCGDLNKRENRLHKYLKRLSEAKDYIKVIRLLEDLEGTINKKQSLTAAEKEALQDLDAYIKPNLYVKGFSVSSWRRLWAKNQIDTSGDSNKIRIFLEHVLIPALQADEKLCRLYFTSTRSFLLEEEASAEGTPFGDAYRALILDADTAPEDYAIYARSVFDILGQLEPYRKTAPSREEGLWENFRPFIYKACAGLNITDEFIWEIRNQIIPSLLEEQDFYGRVKEKHKDLMDNACFYSIGLYRIARVFWEKTQQGPEKDETYSLVAMRLYSYMAESFGIALHPAAKISSPCVLLGKHILVNAGCSIGGKCFIEGDSTISSGLRSTDEAEYSTIIGEKTTIKRGAILTDVTIGSQCIIYSGTMLVMGSYDSNRYIKNSTSSGSLWAKEDYQKHGGYICEEDLV